MASRDRSAMAYASSRVARRMVAGTNTGRVYAWRHGPHRPPDDDAGRRLPLRQRAAAVLHRKADPRPDAAGVRLQLLSEARSGVDFGSGRLATYSCNEAVAAVLHTRVEYGALPAVRGVWCVGCGGHR